MKRLQLLCHIMCGKVWRSIFQSLSYSSLLKQTHHLALWGENASLTVFLLFSAIFLYFKNKANQNCETHLGIPQHDHPHQNHVDVDSQRLVVVNLIHLRSRRKKLSIRGLSKAYTNIISARHLRHQHVTPPIVLSLDFCFILIRGREREKQTILYKSLHEWL